MISSITSSVTSQTLIRSLFLSPPQVSGSSLDDSTHHDQRQMAVVLSEAFQAMRVELDSLPLGGVGRVSEAKTAALLEEYSLLLLQAVSQRLNSQRL